MIFSKMNGCGNDYIFVYLPNQQIDANYNSLAKALSNRNYSIGADGLVLIDYIEDCYYMRIFNADGSEANMCGNAIRCVAKYLYDNKYVNTKTIKITTHSGVKTVHINKDNSPLGYATVDMGIPKLIKIDGNPMVNHYLAAYNKTVTAVDVGNLHAVFFCEELNQESIDIAKKLSQDSMFYDGINAEAVRIINKDNIAVRVWERGSNETMACGTGATASMYAAFIKGLVSDNVNVHLLGGCLNVSFANGHLFMSGDAKLNFNGTVDIAGL